MAAALEGGYDLGALALLGLALGALLLAKELSSAVAGVLDFSVLGFRPLHGAAVAIENSVIGALDDAIKGVEALCTRFLSGLIDAWGLLIAIPLLLGLGVKAALEYFWSSALKPVIHSITDAIKTVADKAVSKAIALEGTVAADLASAEAYTRAHVAGALADAEAYVETRLRSEVAAIGGDIGAAIASAERYADTAVSKLRAAEDAAVAGAVGLAAEAKTAGLLAAAGALAEAEHFAGSAIARSEAAARQALAEAEAAGAAALAGVGRIAVGAADDLATIEGNLGALGLAGLIAALPALATLVQAIAVEAGLSSAECRGKVKGICGTDPLAWAGLLEGAVFLTGALSLRELVPIGRTVIADLGSVIREAA